jgi:hypothetical protein
MKTLPTLAFVLLTMTLSQGLHAQLIANGSFEDNPVGTATGSPPNIIDTTTFTDFRFYNVDSTDANGNPQVYYGASIVADPHTGNNALQLDVNNFTGVVAGNYGLDIDNNHAVVTPNTSYTLSFWALDTQAAVAGEVSPSLQVFVPEYIGGTFSGTQDSYDPTISGGTYQEYSYTFTTGASTDHVNLLFALDSGVIGSGEIHLDDISLTSNAVPEPGSWALLLSGFVALVGFSTLKRRNA